MTDVELRMFVLGVSRETAEYIDAIERGEISGDVVTVDDAGNPVHENASPPETFEPGAMGSEGD